MVDGCHRPMHPRPHRPLVHGGLTGRWRIVVAILVTVGVVNLLGMFRRTQEAWVGVPAGRALHSGGPQPAPGEVVQVQREGVNFSQVHRSRRNHVHWGPGPVNTSTAACVPQALEPGVDCRCPSLDS